MPKQTGLSGIVLRAATGTMVALALGGLWTFTSTRASSEDLEKTDKTVAVLESKVQKEREAQLVFRAEVRSVLKIKKPKPGLE